METRYHTLQITGIAERKAFAIHLVDRFGSTAAASQVIEEMLKVCPQGSDYNALKDIRHKINDGSYKTYSGFSNKTK
jgi:hypothetical protein